MAEPIMATEEDEDALNIALAGISNIESSYDPLAGQRSIYEETDDPDILEANEAFRKLVEEAGEF